ncbi:hypothetical protein NDU88_002614, partial [Pleurodeles waltl]
EIVRFGNFSGVTINWSKSMILPLTSSVERFDSQYPLVWAEGPVRYLGIHLCCDKDALCLANYGAALTWLEEKVEVWSTLPLSLTGRIAIAKMVVLPKFLYLF